MKTELTIENKTKFFAQYWGQNVFGSPYLNGSWDYTGVNFDEIDADEFMLLKPLSSITDEDLNKLLEIQGWGKENCKDIKVNFDEYPELSACFQSDINDYYEVLNSNSVDYLFTK